MYFFDFFWCYFTTVTIHVIFQIVVRLPDGNILLAEERYVDYYNNIMILEVSSESEMKPVDLNSPEIVEGAEVVALSRDFYTCSLSESSGVISMKYPYFGAEELLSSTCSGSQVSMYFLNMKHF